jgi:hypothetical protein
MLGKVVVAAMVLIVSAPTSSFSQSQTLPKVEFITPPPKAAALAGCPLSSCPDYAERLIRHPFAPMYLIPERPMWIDYIRRW